LRQPDASWRDQKGLHRYRVGKRIGPAAEDDGAEIRMFSIDKETGFAARGIVLLPYDYNSEDEKFMTMAATYWPHGPACASWLKTWVPNVPAAPSDIQAQWEQGRIVAAKMGSEPAWAFRLTYRPHSPAAPYTYGDGKMMRPQFTFYVACADSTRGRYTLSLQANSKVFEKFFPILERAMAEFRLEPDDLKSDLACPNDLFAHNKGNSLNNYSCVSECPKGMRPSPPGDFPYQGARVCME